MRPFRVFNRVSKVPVMLKVADRRLGGVSQAVLIATATVSVVLLLAQHLWIALFVIGTGLILVLRVSAILSRLDPDETMSDITAFGMLWRAMRRRHTANYDAFEN